MNDHAFARSRPGARAGRTVFIDGLELDASIGVWPEERGRPQRIVIDVELDLLDPFPHEDDHSRVVCYDALARRIEQLVGEGHVNLVETLADRVADLCLEDARVGWVRIRIEKPQALAKARTVGVRVSRGKSVG